MGWLVHEDRVLASLEVARTRAERTRGLIGREPEGIAFMIDRCRSVHSFGMRFPIDVIFCDADLVVVAVRRLPPRRVTAPVWRARCVIEVPAGTCREWRLQPGDRLSIRD